MYQNGTISSNLYADYFKVDDIYRKQKLIDENINDRTNQATFKFVLQCLLDESEACLYRTDLFEYFITRLRTNSMSAYKDFVLSLSSIEDFILKCPYLEYIGILLLEMEKARSFPREKIKTLLIQKVSSMNFETRCAKFYIMEVEDFLNFKQINNNQVYNRIAPERIFFLQKAVAKVYKCVELIISDFEQEFLRHVLVRWLILMRPQDSIGDYNLLFEIANHLANLANSKQNIYSNHEGILKDTLTSLLNVLKINYLAQDNFTGYSNLVIAIELIDTRELCMCVENNFIEMMQAIGESKDMLGQIFSNLAQANFTSNACSLIRSLAESCRVNMLYDQLHYIFHAIVVPYLIPKLRVERAINESLPLCEFFFYGFAKIPYKFPPSLCDSFAELLDHFCQGMKKDPRNTKSSVKLANYLDFLDCVNNLYFNYSENNTWHQQMNQSIQNVRREFRMTKSQFELDRDLEKAQSKIWQISPEDLKYDMSLVSNNDPINSKFKLTDRFKGIKNIGNTCYLACTMQALFATTEFQDKMTKLITEAIHTSPTRLKNNSSYERLPDILRETQLLFNQLNSQSNSIDCADPRDIRETLPDQFRLANEEQDASEFLKIYLDHLENRLKPTSEKDLVDKCFAGYSETSLKCNTCGVSKTKQEKFLDIVLNFDEGEQQMDELEMLKHSFEPEMLIGNNAILCEKCKKLSPETIKTTKILKLPSYLIVTLNRFKFEKVGVKLTTPVKIHTQIDSKILTQNKSVAPSSYNLYAVLVHIGQSAEHGHYYVLIKDKKYPGGWFLLNDANCYFADLDLSELFTENKLETPYILFYKSEK